MHSILLITGNTDTMEKIRSILRRTYRLFEAEDTPDALKVLSSMPVDIAVVDSVLKNEDSIDAVRRICKAFPEIPLIYITLDPESVQNRQARAMGAFGCIPRSLDEENIGFMVEKAIEKQGLMRDIRYLKSRPKESIQKTEPGPGHVSERKVSGYHTEVIRKLSKAITAVHDLDSLINLLGNALSEIFGATTTMVFIKNPVTKRYEPAAMNGVDRAMFRDVWFDNDHGVARFLNENNQILRRESIETSSYEGTYELHGDLKILKGEVIAPLSYQGELLGFISLGKKFNGISYNDEDIELLALISVYTGIALKNAIDYQQISYSKVCSQSILNHIRTGIISIDTKARITSVNPFAQKLLQLDARRIIGEDVQKAGSVITDLLLRTLRNHSMYVNHEVRDPASNASISVNTSLLKDEEGEIIGVIAFFNDLSEIKKLQSKVEDLRKVEFWSELSARMAHEIRNPLTSIKTFTQLFRERYNDPEFRENFVEIVGKEIEKISSITDQLVTYSRPFEGEVRPVEINGLISEAAATLSDVFRTKKISVKKEIGAEIIKAMGNRDMLREALLRILQNAADFAEEESKITISAKVLTLFDLTQRQPADIISDTIPSDVEDDLLESTHYVEIEVKDNGPGIPEEKLEKVFTPFYSTKVKGIGLGLAIVEKTVQHHRGRIELNSKVGSGTSVRLIIPAYREG